MKKRIKARWINALQSGQYEQAEGQLRKGNQFCCLGVLCDLYRKEVGGKWKKKGRWLPDPEFLVDPKAKDGEAYILPLEVREWAGLTEGDPVLGRTRKYKTLSAQNDSGVKFPRLAELIDRYL